MPERDAALLAADAVLDARADLIKAGTDPKEGALQRGLLKMLGHASAAAAEWTDTAARLREKFAAADAKAAEHMAEVEAITAALASADAK